MEYTVDCVPCPSGQIETDGIQCFSCSLSNNNIIAHPNEDQTECLCPSNYQYVEDNCEPCDENFSTEVLQMCVQPVLLENQEALMIQYAQLAQLAHMLLVEVGAIYV